MERKASEFVIFGLKIGSQCRSVSIISPLSVQIDDGHKEREILTREFMPCTTVSSMNLCTKHGPPSTSRRINQKKLASINKARLGEMLRRY